MITFLVLTLSVPFLSGHPVKPDQACQTLKRFEESLKSALDLDGAPLCFNAQPQSKHVVQIFDSDNCLCRRSAFKHLSFKLSSLPHLWRLSKSVLKASKLTPSVFMRNIRFVISAHDLISNVYFQSLSENQAFFCGGILKFFEMLTSVKALLCKQEEGRESRLFFPDALAGLNDLLGFANADTSTTSSTTMAASSTTTAASTTTTASRYK